MKKLNNSQVYSQTLDHLGLVSATIHDLGLIERIDALLPIDLNRGAKLTIGQRIAAMILTGLGFIDTRLYMFSEFLQDKPLDRLIGEGVKAEYYTDDALGRALDKIHEFGTELFFGDLAYQIALDEGFLGNFIHADTSSLSLYGDYNYSPKELAAMPKPNAESLPTPEVTYGYSKAHRPDLKQVILSMATTGAAGFPIWMEVHSGNASDQKTLIETALRMKAFSEEMDKESADFLYVADSAMYSSCLKQSHCLLWLSRVPERSNDTKYCLELPEEYFAWEDLDNGYKVCPFGMKSASVKQYWSMVYSEQAHHREMITFERNLNTSKDKAVKDLWHLTCKDFGCEEDAKKSALKLEKEWKYYALKFEIDKIKKHQKAGRPRVGAKSETMIYRVKGEVIEDENAIILMKRRKGRFILATNDIKEEKISINNLLSGYKKQSMTESGFKFIKDNTFQVSSVYLEKPGRISALMSVMSLCLMVYNVAQYRLREALKANKETVPDQKGNQTNHPTLKRVFLLFIGIQLLKIHTPDFCQTMVINLNEISKSIIRLFGVKAMEIYDLNGQFGLKTNKK